MTALRALVAAELGRGATPAAQALAEHIVRRHGDAVSAILFYGSCRRTGDDGGLLDLYVLVDGDRRFHRRALPALFNRLLPPDVLFVAVPFQGGTARAKVAVIRLDAFRRRMRFDALDTTLWTRFCQPSTLLFARDPASAAQVTAAIAEALGTAAAWATRLVHASASPADRWRALFARTYRLELRPEDAGRPALVHDASADWFDRAMRSWAGEGVAPPRRPRWRTRQLLGRPLNLLRLVKAAFTFEGGADYLSAKLGRHGGVAPVPTRFQRRHPLLGAPLLLWSHRRALRRLRTPDVPASPRRRRARRR